MREGGKEEEGKGERNKMKGDMYSSSKLVSEFLYQNESSKYSLLTSDHNIYHHNETRFKNDTNNHYNSNYTSRNISIGVLLCSFGF